VIYDYDKDLEIGSDDDSLLLMKFLAILAKLSPYAKIEIKSKNKILIYSIDKLELSAALLTLNINLNNEYYLEKVFKVSTIPMIAKYVIPKRISITETGLSILSLHKQTGIETIINLSWLEIEYPSLNIPSLDDLIKDFIIIDIDRNNLSKILNMFMLSDIDEIKLTLTKDAIYLAASGPGIAILQHLNEDIISSKVSKHISLKIPSIYIRIINHVIRLLNDVRVYMKEKSSLIVGGNVALNIPTSFFLIIPSRNE